MSQAIKELSAIPFGQLIGEPLKAAVEAQAMAARTTVEFIEKVGFVPPSAGAPQGDADSGMVRNVTFTYSKKLADDTVSDFRLTVPILTIVPIPYLRIDEMTIDFSAKLTDMVSADTSSTSQSSAQFGASAKWGPASASFRASMSTSQSRSSKSTFTAEYKMDIHLRAVQDDVPGGLAKVLEILQQAIRENQLPPGTP